MAALDYGGEVHQSVKKFWPRHGYLRQLVECWRRWKDNNKNNAVGSFDWF